MFKKVLKNLNLLIIILNITIFAIPCLAVTTQGKEQVISTSKKILELNKNLRSAKQDKDRHTKMGMTAFINWDNKIIADLEEEKFKLEEELFLYQTIYDNRNYTRNIAENRLTLSKQIININKDLKEAKEVKDRHTKMGMTSFLNWDNRTILELEEKLFTLEEELYLLTLH